MSLLLSALTMVAPSLTAADTAGGFKPGAVWNDSRGMAINAHGGGILKQGDTYYWYGEHKVAGELGNTAQVGVRVYSSRDLYHWQNRGVALPVSQDPTSEIARGAIIERPKVIRNPRTGKYVMWFHLELKGQGYVAARSGVAVSNSPTGPFRYTGSFRPNAGMWPLGVTAGEKTASEKNILERDFRGGQMARDMTLFVDDDDRAYHIFASEENQTLHVSQLSDDYLRPAGRYARIMPGGQNEAPAIFKRGGRYYMITSGLTGWAPNPARSFVADTVMGPWRSLGNPVRGTRQQSETTFGAQSTFALEAPCKGRWILMFDQWRPHNAIDGRHVWLPVEWENDRPVVRWRDHWTLRDLCGA